MAEITLELLGELMRSMREDRRRLAEEISRMRDDITVQTGILMRLEGRNEGLPVEVRGIRLRQDRLIRGVDQHGERLVRLEQADPA